MKIQILTRCTRPSNLPSVQASIISAYEKFIYDETTKIAKPYPDIIWKIIFDTSGVDNVSSKMLSALTDTTPFRIIFNFIKGVPGDYGHTLLNNAIDLIDNDSWVYILDDDNEMHPRFLLEVDSFKTDGIIFSQSVNKRDFTGLDIREAKPENVRVQGIDMAQFVLKKSLIGTKRLIPGQYTADGIFIEELYKAHPEQFSFGDVFCFYNSLQKTSKSYMLPRVVLLGSDNLELKTSRIASFESDDLNIVLAKDENVVAKIIEHDPDSIITIGKSFSDFPTVCNQVSDLKLRWVHLQDETNAGEVAYSCAMSYILSGHNQDMVSVFTPIYNTKDKLQRAYESLLYQTYRNWEWVIVNDSSDTETIIIARNIAKKDPRVRVYDFVDKTRGIIGESKYRACAMSRGKYLLELDHDDVLLPHALQCVVDAFDKYPDAGFVYTDCAEIDENHNSLSYGNGFSFGYGSYRTEHHLGRDYMIADTANINPLTIRHIVGVPNHIRAWRRSTYFEIGGHNRRLSITDDYELFVRTFLATKIVKVQKGCYLQFHHNANSQDSTRSDIQRRVRTIARFYNEKIKQRFEELGVEDWAYTPSGGWNVAPRTGAQENYVNYIIRKTYS